jgi:hypothetical protein
MMGEPVLRTDDCRTQRRWPWLVALILATLALCTSCYLLLPEWQLRHSYSVHLRGGLPREDPFYSYELLARHKARVRQWVAEEFLRRSSLGADLPYLRASKQIGLLDSFGEPADLDILLRRAEIGFPIAPAAPGVTREEERLKTEQENLCWDLVFFILNTCVKLKGSQRMGLELLHQEFGGRKVAPEVRELYERLRKQNGFSSLFRAPQE